MSASRLKPKRRSGSNDGLPATEAEWDTLPDLAEQAYRRGFVHGVAELIYALQAGVSLAAAEKWLYGPVWKWRFQDRMYFSCPPRWQAPKVRPSSAKVTVPTAIKRYRDGTPHEATRLLTPPNRQSQAESREL